MMITIGQEQGGRGGEETGAWQVGRPHWGHFKVNHCQSLNHCQYRKYSEKLGKIRENLEK